MRALLVAVATLVACLGSADVAVGEDDTALAVEVFQAENSLHNHEHTARIAGESGAYSGILSEGQEASATTKTRVGGGVWVDKALPLLLPDESHTKLKLQEEGLAMLQGISTPVALVAVIGPYRSGKSFLLNQLLRQPCDRGFGVGHERHTQTKGMWIWGTPVPLDYPGGRMDGAHVVFVDTEGFESVGRSDVYDDRIFALAAVMSSLLIYNLPENVREADIEKLSFAIDLADEFFGRAQQSPGDPEGQGDRLEASNLMWLIQRDFLQGQTVQEMVDQALAVVPNPKADPELERVNQVRKSLVLMARNSTAFSLVQPHQERTRLCELTDGELDPRYVQQRDDLRSLVHRLAVPKALRSGGKPMAGADLAASIVKTVEALNEGEIPRAGSVVNAFNREASSTCFSQYQKALESKPLPVEEAELVSLHEESLHGAIKCFLSKRFGKSKQSTEQDEVLEEMQEAIAAAFAHRKEANLYQSSKLCDELHESCIGRLVDLQTMRLPSLRRFQASVSECNKTFVAQCIGPSKQRLLNKHSSTMAKEFSLFKKDYNDKLLNGITVVAVAMVVFGRFLLGSSLVEMLGWVSFAALELYPKLSFAGTRGLYDSPTWHKATQAWEVVVFNDVYHLEETLTPVVLWSLVAVLAVLQVIRVCKGMHLLLQRLRQSAAVRFCQWLCPCIDCLPWMPRGRSKRGKGLAVEGFYDKDDPDV